MTNFNEPSYFAGPRTLLIVKNCFKITWSSSLFNNTETYRSQLSMSFHSSYLAITNNGHSINGTTVQEYIVMNVRVS